MRAKGPGQSALLLLDVIDILDKLHIPYAIVGAFAASFYGVVRASMDADAIISLQAPRADVQVLMDELRKVSLSCVYRKGDLDDPIGAVLNIEDNFQNRVDLLMSIHGMTDAVFSRTVETEFMNARIRLIGVEDFIAMKIFAGSSKDLSDVVGVLEVSFKRINLPLLEELVRRYGKDALRKLQSLLKERG
ncbi:MAG: hypothetical protein HYY57_04400 [Candidatus Omnitrophica bacterium]|nr:hypothetical protein [Candidatus Omnitrophota bacterium]